MRLAWAQQGRAATLVERTIAYLVDSLVTALLWLLIVLALTGGDLSRIEGATARGVIAAFLFLLVPFVYFVIAETATATTLGKRLMGLTVTDLAGQRPGVFDVTVRNTLRLAWALGPLGPLFLAADAVLIQQTERDQRVGDLAARTQVLRTGPGPLALGR